MQWKRARKGAHRAWTARTMIAKEGMRAQRENGREISEIEVEMYPSISMTSHANFITHKRGNPEIKNIVYDGQKRDEKKNKGILLFA